MTFQEFDALMYGWQEDVKFLSSHQGMKEHVAFESISEFAKKNEENRKRIIEYTCLMLSNPYVHLCFILLGEFVDNPPPVIPDYYAGRIPVIRECWRYWALKENIVKTNHDVHSYWVEDSNGNKGKWH